MDLHRAFLEDIIASPEDDAPRLIYADWLDENGNPERAEFIRIQIELASLPEDDDRRWPLLAREEELLSAHEDEWRRPFERFFAQESPTPTLWTRLRGLFQRPVEGQARASGSFERGFLESITLGDGRLLSRVEQCAWTHPLHSLEVRLDAADSRNWLSEATVQFSRMRKLSLEVWGLAPVPKSIQRIPELFPRIEHFTSNFATLSPLGISWLARLQTLKLHSLFEGNQKDAFSALSRCDECALVRLELRGGAMSPVGMRQLASCQAFTNLRELDISNNLLITVESLMDSPLASQLRKLCLERTELGPETTRLIASQPSLASLTHLDLSANRLGDSGVNNLALAPHLRTLTRLNLSGCEIGPNGVNVLVQSEHFAGLRSLLLSSIVGRFAPRMNRLGNLGAVLLAQTASLTKLARLELRHTEIGPDGMEAIARSEALANLRALDVTGNNIGDRGIRALVHSPYLGKLQELRVDLRDTHISAWARKALRERFKNALR